MKASAVKAGDKLWFGGVAVDVKSVAPRGNDELTFFVSTESNPELTFSAAKDAELACRLREPRAVHRRKA